MAHTMLFSQYVQHPFRNSRHGQRGTASRLPSFRSSYARQRSCTVAMAGKVVDAGSVSVQGTVRKQNEDRFDVATELGNGITAAAAVYDGHGGYAVSEWLQQNFFGMVQDEWQNVNPVKELDQSFVKADEILLQPKAGFFGAFGERGVGGSKCGATCAFAAIFEDKSGKRKVVSANAGDARVILVRDGKGLQLSEDHVPDVEAERKRIERTNPNPRMPLVRFVGDTWRVGGVLALSRAFGDAYLKGSAQFEGVPAGSDGYSSGFGLTAEPHVAVMELTDQDSWVIVCSDGLCGNVQRGAGGGLDNDEIARMASSMAKSSSADDVAAALADAAQQAGSTDDVTVLALKLA